MRRVMFVVSSRGLGHITRCRALACELGRRGWASSMSSHAPIVANSVDACVVDMDDGESIAEGAVLRAVGSKPTIRLANSDHMTDDIRRYYDTLVHGRVPHITIIASPGETDSGAMWAGIGGGYSRVLVGGKYALLRPEFVEARDADSSNPVIHGHGGLFDCRDVADWSATQMAYRMRFAYPVITYGGMRALESACVRKGGVDLLIYARNRGEELNKQGLADGQDHIDGRGCQRVADALEELVK